MTSTLIFENAGPPESLVGKGIPRQCMSRCKKKMKLKDEESFQNETRGKETRAKGKPKRSIEDQFEEANARIAYLKGNLNLVKKLEMQERSVKIGTESTLKTSERYELIDSIIREYRLTRMVTHLCEVTDVSKSGYYYWKNSEATRYKKYVQDSNDFELFHHVYNDKKKCGVDGIKMALEAEYDIVMNHKKIRRILLMYGIISPLEKLILTKND